MTTAPEAPEDTDAPRPRTRARRIGEWFARYWLTGPGLNGAAVGTVVLGLVVWGWRAAERIVPSALGISLLITAADLLVIVGVALAVVVVGTGVARLFKRRFPVPFLAAFASSAVLLGSMAPGPSVGWWAWMTTIIALSGSVVGGVIGHLWAGRPTYSRKIQIAARTTVSVVALAAMVTGTILVWPGSGESAEDVVKHGGSGTTVDNAADAGPLAVTFFAYGGQTGSGRYGDDADVASGTVDASEQLPEWADQPLRTRGMGFDASELPLNATVWAPDAEPPAEGFPLVLIAHGNSAKADNELGFEYLGEHLASQGYVVASVEQTYLNTGLFDTLGSLELANQMRARMLMEHLDQWQTWERESSPEVPRVDLSKTVLAGHSRGGEAAAVAATMHNGTASTSVPWPVPDLPDVDIRTVVALAPTAGVIVPVAELEGIDYFTVSATHDADLSTFAGARQFEHTAPGPDGISAAVLLERANHTQFNEDWGRYDTGAGISTRMLNTAVLIEPEEQQQATKGLVTTFLRDSLYDDGDARAYFTGDIESASWLPPSHLRAAVKTGLPEPIADFAGAAVEMEDLPRRSGSWDHEVIRIRGEGSDGSVEFRVNSLVQPDAPEEVTFDLADAAPVGYRTEPMAVRSTAEMPDGPSIVCDIGEVGATFDGQYGKIPAFMPNGPGEPFLSTFTVPSECTYGAVGVVISVSGVGEQGIYLDGVEVR